MAQVTVEKPKDYYAEVKELIRFHYKYMPSKGFNYSDHSFANRYPTVYRLFLQIAALGFDR